MIVSAAHLWLLTLALVLDALVGDPDFLWRRLPHPVALFGSLVGFLDVKLNGSQLSAETRRRRGITAVGILIAVAITIGILLERLFALIPYGWVGTIVVAAVFLAGRSLYDHVAAVAVSFDNGGLPAARTSVSRIVGRDPESLDESGVCRAAIESTAENFSDGVVAPALWFALLGLPGLLAYKAINTADSMIGHRTPRHAEFGWAAARLDDLVNIPASRLAGALVALASPLAGGSVIPAFRTMLADAGKHRSPNAGWPEAAMAAALGVALAGPRSYKGVVVPDPYMNAAGRKEATARDIRRALRVYVGASALLLAMVVAAAVLLSPL